MKDFAALATRLGTVAAGVAIAAAAQVTDTAPTSTLEERAERHDEEQLALAERGIDDRRQAFAQIAATGARREAWSNYIQTQIDTGKMTPAEAREERKTFVTEIRGEYAALNRTFGPVLGGERKADLSTVDGATRAYLNLFDEANITDEQGIVVGWDQDKFFDELEPAFIATVGPEMWARIETNTGVKNRASWELEMAEVAQALDESGFFTLSDDAWALIKQFATGPDGERAARFDSYFDYRREMIEAVENMLRPQRGDAVAKAVALDAFRADPLGKRFSAVQSQLRSEWIARHLRDGLAEDALRWEYIDPNLNEKNEQLITLGRRERAELESAVPAR